MPSACALAELQVTLRICFEQVPTRIRHAEALDYDLFWLAERHAMLEAAFSSTNSAGFQMSIDDKNACVDRSWMWCCRRGPASASRFLSAFIQTRELPLQVIPIQH